MGFDFGIKAIFGGDTSQLKASMMDAQSQLKGFKKEAEGMGIDVGKLALSAVFIKAGMAIAGLIDKARDMRDEAEKMGRSVDSSISAMASIADAATSAIRGIISLVSEGIGSLAMLGRMAGEQYNKYVRGMSEGTQKQIELAERAQLDSIERIEKAKQTLLSRTQEAYKKLDETQKKYVFEDLSQREKVDAIEEKIVEKMREIQGVQRGTIGYAEREIELEELKARFRTENKTLLAEEKRERSEIAKTEKESLKESARLEKEWRDATSLSLADEVKVRALSLKQAHELTAEEQVLLDTLRLQKEQKGVMFEIDSIRSKGLENLSDEENQLLNTLALQSEEIVKQIAAKSGVISAAAEQLTWEEKITNEIRKQNAATSGGKITTVGAEYSQQSTANLKYVLANLRDELADAQKSFTPGVGLSTNPMSAVILSEISKVENELGIRASAEALIRRYGEEGARERFSLGPDAFDRILSYIEAGSESNTQKIVDNLQKIRETLAGKYRNT
jgi:hypothetical protein